MFRTHRVLAVVLLAGVALMSAGCGSNNKDKIVGKWKFIESPNADAETKKGLDMMAMMGAYMYFDFNADNTVVIGVESDKPGMLDLLKMSTPGGTLTFPAKYKLLSGNKVEFYDLSPEAKALIKGADKGRMVSEIMIDGGKLTMKDPDGSIGKFERYKAPAAGAGAGAGAAGAAGGAGATMPDTEARPPRNGKNDN